MSLPDVPHHIIPTHHAAIDIGSIALIILSALGYLPTVAAGLACLWYVILIVDRFRSGRKAQN
jgi:hypothetical protein